MHKTSTPINGPACSTEAITLATQIVAAQVIAGEVSRDEVPKALEQLARSISGMLPTSAAAMELQPHTNGDNVIALAQPRQKPAVPIAESVQPDHLICLEDGVRRIMLKRYLREQHGLSVDEYRRKWGLKPDYPMVAPEYTKQKRMYAELVGLGKYRRHRQS